MLSSPSILTWVSAAAALGLVGVITWRRRHDPARLALGAMTAAAGVAGLVGGSSVPAGPRLSTRKLNICARVGWESAS